MISSLVTGGAIVLGVIGAIPLGLAIGIAVLISLAESALLVSSSLRSRADRTAAGGDQDLDELAKANPGVDFSPEE